MTTARVDLTTNEIIDGNNNSYDAKIPILKRRAASAASGGGDIKDPICVIVVGMAGRGKTTLMSQLQKSLSLRDDDNDSGDNDSDDSETEKNRNNKKRVVEIKPDHIAKVAAELLMDLS